MTYLDLSFLICKVVAMILITSLNCRDVQKVKENYIKYSWRAQYIAGIMVVLQLF
jgi:hypothetical protein